MCCLNKTKASNTEMATNTTNQNIVEFPPFSQRRVHGCTVKYWEGNTDLEADMADKVKYHAFTRRFDNEKFLLYACKFSGKDLICDDCIQRLLNGGIPGDREFCTCTPGDKLCMKRDELERQERDGLSDDECQTSRALLLLLLEFRMAACRALQTKGLFIDQTAYPYIPPLVSEWEAISSKFLEVSKEQHPVACTQCTFLNSHDSTSCEICQTPFPMHMRHMVTFQQSQVACTACTFLNSHDSTSCEICQTPFPIFSEM